MGHHNMAEAVRELRELAASVDHMIPSYDMHDDIPIPPPVER